MSQHQPVILAGQPGVLPVVHIGGETFGSPGSGVSLDKGLRIRWTGVRIVGAIFGPAGNGASVDIFSAAGSDNFTINITAQRPVFEAGGVLKLIGISRVDQSGQSGSLNLVFETSIPNNVPFPSIVWAAPAPAGVALRQVDDPSGSSITITGMAAGKEYAIVNRHKVSGARFESQIFADNNGNFTTKDDLTPVPNIALGLYAVLLFGPGAPALGLEFGSFRVVAEAVDPFECPDGQVVVIAGGVPSCAEESPNGGGGNGGGGNGGGGNTNVICAFGGQPPVDAGGYAVRAVGDPVNGTLLVSNVLPGTMLRVDLIQLNAGGTPAVVVVGEITADGAGQARLSPVSVPDVPPTGRYDFRVVDRVGGQTLASCRGLSVTSDVELCEDGTVLAAGEECVIPDPEVTGGRSGLSAVLAILSIIGFFFLFGSKRDS